MAEELGVGDLLAKLFDCVDEKEGGCAGVDFVFGETVGVGCGLGVFCCADLVDDAAVGALGCVVEEVGLKRNKKKIMICVMLVVAFKKK